MADFLKLLDTGAGMVGLEDELELIAALAEIGKSWRELVDQAKTIDGADSAQALLAAIIENVDDPKLDPLFEKLPGAREKLKALLQKVGALKDKIPEKYWRLLEPLSVYEGGEDGKVEWALDGEKDAQLGGKVKLGVKGAASLRLDAAASAKVGETDLKPLLLIGAQGEVKADASGKLPIQWGSIEASVEASVSVGLDYYFDPATSTPLYAVAVAERILNLPDPFDYQSMWQAFQGELGLAGIVYHFDDSAKAKVGVALGLSGGFEDKVLAEVKLGLSALAAIENRFHVSLRALPKAGGVCPVEIILARGSTKEGGIGVDIGIKVDFDAAVAPLRDILNKAIAKSEDVLGRIAPYLAPGTWLRDKFGEEVEAAATSLLGDPALTGLRDALVADLKSIVGAPEPGDSALVALLSEKLTGAIDDAAGDLTELGEAGRAKLVARVVAALPAGLGDQAGAALDEKTRALVGPLVEKAAGALEEELKKLVALPDHAFGKALKEANAAASKNIDRVDEALAPVRTLIDRYNDLLGKVKTYANDTTRTRLAATIKLEESWKWGEEEKIVGRFDAGSDAAAQVFEEITRGKVEKLKARLLDNIAAARAGAAPLEPTPGFTLLPGSRIKYSASRTSKAGLELTLLGFGESADVLLSGDADLIIDVDGKVQVDSHSNLKKRFKAGKESREISFVDTYALRIARAGGPSADDVRAIDVGVGISHIDEELKRDELEGFVKSLAGAGLVTSDTTPLALAKFDAMAGGKTKITADLVAKLALNDAQLRTLMDIDNRRMAADGKVSDDYKKRIVRTALQASVAAEVQNLGQLKVAADRVSGLPVPDVDTLGKVLFARLGQSRAILDGISGQETAGDRRAFAAALRRMEAMTGLIWAMGEVYLATPKVDETSPPGAWSVGEFTKKQKLIADCGNRWLQTGGGFFGISDGVSKTTVAFLATMCDLIGLPRLIDGEPIGQGIDIMSLHLVHRDGDKVLTDVPLTQAAPLVA